MGETRLASRLFGKHAIELDRVLSPSDRLSEVLSRDYAIDFLLSGLKAPRRDYIRDHAEPSASTGEDLGRKALGAPGRGSKLAPDSPLEEGGFELSVRVANRGG
jgi:hypothetical protein